MVRVDKNKNSAAVELFAVQTIGKRFLCSH